MFSWSRSNPHRRRPTNLQYFPSEEEEEEKEESSAVPSSHHRHQLPPDPQPVFQWLGFGFIVFLAFLQFFPATHFRHPSDPLRNWVPFHSNSTQSQSSSHAKSNLISARGKEDERVHILSWMDCMDLRVLAVLMNSTLANTRYPELVSLHFFLPEGLDIKVSYHKLKVLFPHSDLEILGQEKVKGQIEKAYPTGEYPGLSFYEIAPFVIPILYPTLSKFIYVSPDFIMKGRVEEIIGVNMENYGIAVREDCSKPLSFHVNFDVLDAVQRTAAKPWVSSSPYSRDSCMPDLNLILIDATRMGPEILEAIAWWSRVLKKSQRDGLYSAVALSIYDRHMKLETEPQSLIHRYDHDGNIYSRSCGGAARPDLAALQKMHLPPLSDQILSNN